MAALTACGESDTPAPSPGPGGSEPIRGTERLGWDQQAGSSSELATFQYAIYVDGSRTQMADVSCASAAGEAGFACSGRLPSMTQGTHTLELAAFFFEGDRIVEGPRSGPLSVTVSPSATAPVDQSTAVRRAEPRENRGLPGFGLDAVASGFGDITDVRVLPDRRVLVAERDGAVRMMAGGVADLRPALLVPDHILSVAVDPGFETNRFVYALQADTHPVPSRLLRIVRYREVGGLLGERAVLLDGLVSDEARPAGEVRFGPDGRLYAAISDSDAPGRARTPERAGTLLRLNPDGTTPADQPGLDRVVVDGFFGPRGLDWQPGSAALWVADGAALVDRLWAVPSNRRQARLGLRDAEYRFSAGTGVHGMAFYAGAIPTLRGTLLVAADAGLLRVRFNPRDGHRIDAIDILLDEPMRAVATGADGSLYVATATELYQVVGR
jgi:glucose/arabinose dehydrogenase